MEVGSLKMEDKAGFKFEKLIIWQKAMDFGEEINVLTRKFPKYEVFNLSSQIRRAADSIALNISDASIGQSNPEFNKFLGYSVRSLVEVVSCFHKAQRREYITNDEFLYQYEQAHNLMNMMIAFRSKLK